MNNCTGDSYFKDTAQSFRGSVPHHLTGFTGGEVAVQTWLWTYHTRPNAKAALRAGACSGLPTFSSAAACAAGWIHGTGFNSCRGNFLPQRSLLLDSRMPLTS